MERDEPDSGVPMSLLLFLLFLLLLFFFWLGAHVLLYLLRIDLIWREFISMYLLFTSNTSDSCKILTKKM